MRWTAGPAILACFLITGCLEYDPGGSGEPPDCDCETDTDCPSMHICDDCRCAEVCYCESNADCGPGMLCRDCLCQPSCNCQTDADCPQGHYCTELCTCERECACQSDGDCPAGDWCVDCTCSGCEDLDGDGFTSGHRYADCDVDCNDLDAGIHPGAAEICGDQIDNNCDGLVDEDCLCDCLTDVDCPEGFFCTELCTCEPVCMCVSDADCDDGNAATLDQCIDCHCENLGCACDADQDGWCCCAGEPDGGCDCDDSDPQKHPGSEEICGDWIDNDCDGLVDEDCECDCISDDECPADYFCWDCWCLPYYHCTTGSECPSGWLCQQHGVVCDVNHPCNNGFCIPG